MNRAKSGFTLIELLVVISIIGMLASIVLASVTSARLKGKDASVQEMVLQFRNLYELVYSQYGSYAALQPIPSKCTRGSQAPDGTWDFTCAISSASGCSIFTNANVINVPNTQAAQLCTGIAQTASPASGDVFGIEVGGSTGTVPNVSQKYSVAGWLPSQGKFFCAGSSGQTSIASGGYDSNSPGCGLNP